MSEPKPFAPGYHRVLDETAYRVWEAIPAEGRTTPEQLAADLLMPPDLVIRVLFVLVYKGVAVVRTWYENHDPLIQVERQPGRPAQPPRGPGRRGYGSKVDRNRKVAERWDAGATIAELSKDFGVSTTRVSQIIHHGRAQWNVAEGRWSLPPRPPNSP